jgi:hypothetical protein
MISIDANDVMPMTPIPAGNERLYPGSVWREG